MDMDLQGSTQSAWVNFTAVGVEVRTSGGLSLSCLGYSRHVAGFWLRCLSHVFSPVLPPETLQDNTNGDVTAPVLVSCAVTSVSALRPVQWRAFDGQLVVWNR
jgi:hypothetical protein